MRESSRDGTHYEVLGQVEELEILTCGDTYREGGVDKVVGESEVGKKRKAAKEGGKRALELEVGEVD